MIGWSVVAGALFGLVLLAFEDVIPRAFTSDEAVIAQAHEIWWIFALLMPANGAVFALDGILIGAGDTRFLMWGMLVGRRGLRAGRAARARSGLGHPRRVGRARRADPRPAGHLRRTLRGQPVGADRRPAPS